MVIQYTDPHCTVPIHYTVQYGTNQPVLYCMYMHIMLDSHVQGVYVCDPLREGTHCTKLSHI